MRAIILIVTSLCMPLLGYTQALFVAGPMQGYTEYRTAKIWVEVSNDVDSLQLTYTDITTKDQKTITGYKDTTLPFFTHTFILTALEPGTVYNYTIVAYSNGKEERATNSFKTQSLWQYRTSAPNFSFLTGSCAYIIQQRYDRPGEPYGGDSSIFLTMAKRKAEFMLWLGDNWYTREVDYYSPWGLAYRAHHNRGMAVLQDFLKSTAHYAIWDDHDYGPNNFGISYIFKEESRQVFKSYWANPSYGEHGEGIYTQFAYGDVAFFLLDDRTWRNADDMKDSIGGLPNSEKQMFGPKQMKWLKDALVQSRYSSFKIIATGSQVLNSYSPYDCLYHYPTEWKELIDFITENNIEGVIFLSGDRHRSEIIKLERKEHYTLYDITVSPLTAHRYNATGVEKDIPTRVALIEGAQNFGEISVSGAYGNRKLHIDFINLNGEVLDSWEIDQKSLKEP